MFSLLEKRDGPDNGFESENFARKRDELLRYFVRYPEHIVFRWNINTYVVLIKGNPEQIQELTDRCLEGIERICGSTDGALDWYAAAGEPVERLSMLAKCYTSANHQFAYRFLMPTVHIFKKEVTDNYMPPASGGKIGDIDSSTSDIAMNFTSSSNDRHPSSGCLFCCGRTSPSWTGWTRKPGFWESTTSAPSGN